MQAQVLPKLVCRRTLKAFYPYEDADGKVRCSECHEIIFIPAEP
jgi:hypothetical protein